MKSTSFVVALTALVLPHSAARGALSEQHVLILTNASSEVSAYVADMYRSYYPGIEDQQVLKLNGLADSAGPSATPATEIITRADYESLIAQPVRDYLIAMGLENDVLCILTTAGLPYRIEDDNPALADIVKPAGSNAGLVLNNLASVTAASVESELSVLWQTDPALANGTRLILRNRVVNPFHGYDNSIAEWEEGRDVLNNRLTFRWTAPWQMPVIMEGEEDPQGISALNRYMGPGDVILTCRLDGPRYGGELPIFAVRKMLERAARAGDLSHPRFRGYSPQAGVMVMDHVGQARIQQIGNLVNNFIANFPPSWDYGGGTEEALLFLNSIPFPVPPTAHLLNQGDDYVRMYKWLIGSEPPAATLTISTSSWGLGAQVVYDDTSTLMNQDELAGESLFALATWGKHSGDGRDKNYLLNAGPGAGPLFIMAPGAVFVSAESFNGVTLFLDDPPNSYQGRIAHFFEIGGSGAIGHAFEPLSDALADSEFFFSNLIRDEDGDGTADLSFVEAAFSALPFLSWAEVIVGDPLMRLRAGPGGSINLAETGDFTGDGIVDSADTAQVLARWGAQFGDDDYDDRADFTEDGVIDEADFLLHLSYFGTNWNSAGQRKYFDAGGPGDEGSEIGNP